MAKDKEKNKVAGAGKKWAVWKTVLVVISSVIFVSGVTLLGIYLAGGLRNPVTPPEDIDFVVDSDLYNPDKSQFEVTEDFELVLTSSTEQVTERQVRLSFTGSTTTNPSTGTISDGVITVPQIVNIGEPFTVTLNMTGYQELGGQNWIAGGISTLIATSMANDQADPISVKIAVDVPVYDIEIELYDEDENQISQVTELERFYPRAKFLPEKSRYCYSDDAIVAEEGQTVERRTKNVYFEGLNSDNIVFFFNEGNPYFEAGGLSAENSFSIVGYTFIHADDQASTLTELETLYQGEELYKYIINTELGDANIGKSNTGTFEIVQASIRSFTIGRSSISVTAGMTSRIAVASSQNADASLDASIISTDNESLEGMLRNVAVRFTRVEGAEIIDANDMLNVRGGEKIVVDEKTYIKVNDDVLDYNYSYLDISPMSAGTYNIEVVLLLRDGTGEYSIFAVDEEPVVHSVVLTVKQNTEAQLSWSNGGTDITIPLQYKDGVVQPQLYDLSSFAVVPEGNAYQTVVYFASFENSVGVKVEDILASWQGERKGEYLVGADTRTLYPFQGSNFSVIGDGEFELYFATIRTINGQIQYNEDGTYQTVQFVSDPITVRVEKSLHEGSVTALTTNLNGNGFDYNGGIYVQEGSITTIDLIFEIDQNSFDTLTEVFNQNMLGLKILSVSGQDISSSFTLSKGTLTQGEEEGSKGTLSYNLAINPSLGLGLNEFLTIGSAELADRGSGIAWRMAVTTGEDNRQITLYSPQPVSITLSGNDNIDLDSNIEIVQELQTDGNFKTTITQNQQAIAENVEDLIGKLSVQVTDQIGQTSTLGNWIWETDNESAVTISGQSFSFRSTGADEAVSANLWVTYANYLDIKSEEQISLSIKSTGINAIMYDNTQTLLDGAAGLVDWTKGLGEVSLSKYGAKGKTIRLADLVKLYLDEDKGQEYTTPKFRFNANELYLLEDDVVSLFGATKGIISLTLEEGEVTSDNANEICSVLTSSYVTSLTFKNNFGTSQALRFEIVDAGLTGAVDIDLNLQILANSTLQTEATSVEAYASTNIAFAGFSITNNNDSKPSDLKTYLADLYENRYYYIVQDTSAGTGNLYTFSSQEAGKVGKINDDGTITFDDFWNEEERAFALRIYLDGIDVTNSFAPVATINFTIKRNLSVTYTGKSYQILSDGDNGIADYITAVRIEGEAVLPDITYTFGNDAPLTINGTTISQSQTYFFDYNEIAKACSLEVKIGENKIATFDNFTYTLGSDTYTKIAEAFTNGTIKEKYRAGTIQKVTNADREEVQYLYLTTGDWQFGKDKNGVTNVFNGYNVQMKSLFQKDDLPDGINSAYLSVNTNYTMTSEFQANFKNSTSVMTGLENKNVYLLFEVSSSSNTVQARIVMPLIISNYGKVFGVFDDNISNDQTADINIDHKDMSLANILSDANTLIENDIYTEVYAGESIVVARQLKLTDTFKTKAEDSQGLDKETGLYYLPNSDKVSARITLITGNTGYRNGLLRKVTSGQGVVDYTFDNATGNYIISLNHLEKAESEVYVAVQFTLRYEENEQNFTYVLKVLPTVDVKEGVYAYNTPTEYLTPDDNNQIEVDLAQKFGNTTLHNGETRFNYEFKANAQNKDDLKYSYSVESLTLDNDQVLTEESEWSRYISFAVDENEIMRIVIQEEGIGQPLKLQIARVYDGGSDGLAVIGGNGAYRQTYNFTINGTETYRLNYGQQNSGQLSSSGNDATWDINSITNGWEESGFTSVAGEKVGDENTPAPNPTYYLSNTGVDYYYFDSKDQMYNDQGVSQGYVSKELKILATTEKVQIAINGEQVECFQVSDTEKTYYVKVSDGEQRNSITNVQRLYFTENATIYSDTNGTDAGESFSKGEWTPFDSDYSGSEDYYKISDNKFVEKSQAVVVAGKEFDKDMTTVYTAPQSGKTTDLKLKGNYITLCTYTLPLTLFSSSGSTQTPTTGMLQANAWVKDGKLTDIVADVIYDGSNSMLTIIPLQYLGLDKTFNISFYTSYGYIGGLTVNVAGSAKVTMKENPQLIAGTKKSVKDLIDRVEFRGENATSYTISSVTINSVTTTNAGGEVTYGSEQKYITWASAVSETSTPDTLTLRSSTRDYTADLTITLKFDEGQQYTFNHTIAVKSNISQVGDNNKVVGLTEATAQTISLGDVVAGTEKEIDQDELFRLSNTAEGAEFKYSWVSNNPSVIASQDQEGAAPLTFTPAEVGNAGSDVTLMVKVTMNDGGEDGLNSDFYVRLQVHVVCAGKVTVNYPVIGETKLQAEYLESGATFSTAKTFFFESSALFAEKEMLNGEEQAKNRVQLENVSAEGQTTQPKVTITEMQNIDIVQGNAHKNSSQDGNTISLETNLQFVLGNYDSETNGNTDSGEESYVIFQINYKGYTEVYVVYVQKSVYGLSFNMASNNKASGDNGTEVEKFYVEDLLSDTYIFTNNRMLKYTVRDGAPTGTYYLELTPVPDSETGENTPEYIEFVITEGDRGQTKYIELGKSYAGYNGIYSRSGDAGDYDYDELSNDSYFVGTPTLTARITLTYTVGIKGDGNAYTDYEVPYDSFKDIIAFDELDTNEKLYDYQISQTTNLGATQNLTNFKLTLGNGQTSATKDFANGYSYTTSLNVGATTYIHDGNFPIEDIEAREEINLVEKIGLIRQSTGEAYSRDMFNENRTPTSGKYLSFSIIDPKTVTANSEDAKKLIALYNYTHNNANKESVDPDVQTYFAIAASGTYNYMAYSPVNDQEGKNETAYDIRVRGLGAPIGGRIIVCKLTYNVKTGAEDDDTFSQDFYVAFNILPAYTITVNGVEMKTQDGENNENYLANLDNPYEATIATGSTYNIDLTAGASPLVVGYKNETTSNLLDQFEKEVKTGETIDGVEYNNKMNANNKNVFPSGTDDDWSFSSDIYTCSRGAGTTLTPSQVEFADQKYRIKMTDVYGYYFYFYFTLKATGTTPTLVSTNINLTEGDTFDFTTSSTVYSISAGEKTGDTTPLTISSNSQNAPTTQQDNAVAIELNGFKFWFFDEDYANKVDNVREAYLQQATDGKDPPTKIDVYEAADGYTITGEDVSMLTPSNYQKITVSSIVLYDENNDDSPLYSINLSSISDDNKHLKVAGEKDLWHISKGQNIAQNGGLTYTIPTIGEGAKWQGSGTIDAFMAVTFKYDPDNTNSDDEEYCVVNIPFTLYRETQITSPNSYVRDGVAFDVSKYIVLQNEKDKNISKTFIDDTLEVYVPANAGVTLKIEVQRNENGTNTIKGSKTFTVPSTHTVQKTYYYSISSLVGVNLKSYDKIYITATQASSGKVYAGGVTYTGYAVGYSEKTNNTSGGEDGKKYLLGSEDKEIIGPITTETTRNDSWLTTDSGTNGSTFTAVAISDDRIGIADPLLFSEGDYTTVQQYYVIEATIDNTPVSYLYTKDYRVTRAYSSVTVNDSDSRVTATPTNANNGPYSIAWSAILDKLAFSYLKEGNSPETISDGISPTQFKLEVTEAGSGSASVNASNGTITTSANFDQQNEYITLVFYRKASGADGVFGSGDDKPESQPFLTYRFQITTKDSTT